MATRRERMEARARKRAEWAEKARAKADGLHARNLPFRGDWAFNTQPGHIPERARVIAREDRAHELTKKAKRHEGIAGELERQLDRSIFSDDADALESLAKRIAAHREDLERMKLVNKLFRKNDAAGLAELGIDLEQLRAKLLDAGPWFGKAPHMQYEFSNLRNRIRADEKRLELVKRRQERSAAAEASPNGVTLEGGGEWVSITFAEKPAREVLEALKDSGFMWRGGSWSGCRLHIPPCVRELLPADTWYDVAPIARELDGPNRPECFR